jgi:hypothetical protein
MDQVPTEPAALKNPLKAQLAHYVNGYLNVSFLPLNT